MTDVELDDAYVARLLKRLPMLVSLAGIRQPAICEASHWTMFTTLMQQPDLYDPLHTRIIQAVSANVNAQPNGAAIESACLGAQILRDIGG